MARILIIEDDNAINDLLKLNLELAGHECYQVFDGKNGLKEATENHYDLILIDIMLPGCSGYDILENIKGIPAIVITARSALQDKVKGLSLGADDYITKPFDILELNERVKAVLRRTKAESHIFRFDDICIDFDKHFVYRNSELIDLKPKEYALLEAFINNRNLALSREKLLQLVWEHDYEGDLRTVDVHVQRIRRKLGISKRLQTVYKTGYRLDI